MEDSSTLVRFDRKSFFKGKVSDNYTFFRHIATLELNYISFRLFTMLEKAVQ